MYRTSVSKIMIFALVAQLGVYTPVKAGKNDGLWLGIGAALAVGAGVYLAKESYDYYSSDEYAISSARQTLDMVDATVGYLYGHADKFNAVERYMSDHEINNLYNTLISHHTRAESILCKLRTCSKEVESQYRMVVGRHQQRVNEYADTYTIIMPLAHLCDALAVKRDRLYVAESMINTYRPLLDMYPVAQDTIKAWQECAYLCGSNSAYTMYDRSICAYVMSRPDRSRYPYVTTISYLNGIIRSFENQHTHAVSGYIMIKQALHAVENLKELKHRILALPEYKHDLDRKHDDERRELERQRRQELERQRLDTERRIAQAAERQALAAEQQVRIAQENARQARRALERMYQEKLDTAQQEIDEAKRRVDEAEEKLRIAQREMCQGADSSDAEESIEIVLWGTVGGL